MNLTNLTKLFASNAPLVLCCGRNVADSKRRQIADTIMEGLRGGRPLVISTHDAKRVAADWRRLGFKVKARGNTIFATLNRTAKIEVRTIPK